MSSESLPPAQPAFVLRGHSAQIHALHFTQNNYRLLSGDAEGWVVSWNISSKRPVGSWKGHDQAILGLGSWGQDRIITHGRDHKLIVWQLGEIDENAVDKILPVDTPSVSARQPWVLHVLNVNALNFCSFAMCIDGMSGMTIKSEYAPKPILIAVPNTIDSGGIDVYQLPSETRAATIHADRNITTGMVMALNIVAEATRLQIVAGYESGHTMVFVQTDPGASFQKLYCARPHSQPVLSMAVFLPYDYYITSSADATIAKHPLPLDQGIWNAELKPIKICQTKHSGQQGLRIRSDGKIFATAGWDARVRVYSAKTMKELAVLKWHKTGCYATAFAQTDISVQEPETTNDEIGDTTLTKQNHSVQQRRDEKAQTTHWLVAGSKDGKVSLWDIY